MRRSLFANVALVSAALAFSLGAVEVGLRFLAIAPLADLFGGREQLVRASEDPAIGYELIPGASGRAWGTDVRVNAHGFRGPEPRRGAGLRRVVVLGDSVAFGNEVPAGAELPAQLGALLRASDPRFEVLNFALGGYDTLQELATLERRALAFAPERVVIAYCLNDAGIVSTNREYVERVARYRTSPWLEHSRTAQLVLHRFDAREHARFTRAMNEPEAFRALHAGRLAAIDASEASLREHMARAAQRHPSDWYRDEGRVGRIRYAFGRIRELANAHAFRVDVAVFPWLEAPEGAYPHAAAHAIVAHEAARQGFGVIDLYAPFAAAGLERLRAKQADYVHPNAEGHALAARHVAAALLAGEPSAR